MSCKIISGKEIGNKIRQEIKVETEQIARTGLIPGLAVVLVGDDPASATYVKYKEKACNDLGFYSQVHRLSGSTTQSELLSLIDELTNNNKIHGILVQLPLPKHIDENAVINAIPAHKDVDAFHPENVGKLMIGDYTVLPCTPAGVMELLRHSDIQIAGSDCVVIGRSNIVGKPMAMMLIQASGTVTVCHSKTKNLSDVVGRADIVVVAIGRAGFLTGDMLKKGAVVIDVGTTRGDDGKIHGDADFESCSKVASYITPVPGGVGPMTITMLMKNTLEAAKNSR